MPRFLQAHFLTSYPPSLLNRDQDGYAKRIMQGGYSRLRISSQCRKRAWRDELMARADAEFPTALRSRAIFEQQVLPALVAKGVEPERARRGLHAFVSFVVDGAFKTTGEQALPPEAEGSLVTKQPMLVGRREINVIVTALARELSRPGTPQDLMAELVGMQRKQTRSTPAASELAADSDATPTPSVKKAAKKAKAAEEWTRKPGVVAQPSFALMLGVDDSLAYGVETAMFGRFTTSDLLAGVDSAVSVGHAMTVHAAATELDFFSVVDDLGVTTGADHLGDTELSTGMYYSYLAIDLPALAANLAGYNPRQWPQAAPEAAKAVTEILLKLAATKSPGAMKGATAPYTYASLVLLEVGNAFPHQLSDSFLKPVVANEADLLESSAQALAQELAVTDRMYPAEQAQRFYAVRRNGLQLPNAVDCQSVDATIAAAWAAAVSGQG